MRKIQTINRHVLEPHMQKYGKDLAVIISQWRDIVGYDMAQKCVPHAIRRNRNYTILELAVDPAFSTDIYYAQDQLMHHIAIYLACQPIDKIHITKHPMPAQKKIELPTKMPNILAENTLDAALQRLKYHLER